MKNRKVVAFILTLALVLSSFSVSFASTEDITAGVNPVVFTDVTDHWASAAISKWAGYGIINGYEGLFRPDDSITRGEMAVILDNMMDYQAVAANTFTDLQSGQFYTESVLKANAAGIIKGDGVTVRPTDKITKEEAAVMLKRAFAVADASSTKAFLDASSVSEWAKGAVFGMEAKGYVNGFGGYFNPKANITRAEAVTMINNIVKAYYTAAGTYTDNVEGTAVIKVPNVILKGLTVSENLIIAEGVAKGDATLDSVTVKGETVIRGGGENSVHITGKSVITKVTIEKVGDKLRVVIDDGITVSNVEVAAGEEIVITGSVGTVELNAPNATVYANAAEIKTANIAGENSTIIVGAQSTVDNVTVSSTAENSAIKTETGAVVKAITASADVEVSGTGTVTKVTLNTGADGSSITTPNTTTTVPAGVTGVTGGGGTTIPAGSTGTNGSSGTTATVTTTPTTGGGGGGGGSGSSTVAVTGITVTSTAVTITTNDGTLQMTAVVAPTNATNQNVTWSITNGTGYATINSSGLLTAVSNGTVTVTAVSVSNGTVSGSLGITLSNQVAEAISIAAISGVTAPVKGATPVTTITATDQFTGTVSWSGSPSTFAAYTTYSATITLTAKPGRTLTGVAANYFTVAGATATNGLNSGVITAVFPATAPVTYASTGTLTKTAISVTFGATSVQAVGLLDQSVRITGTLGETTTAAINWAIPGYSATTAGVYAAFGSLSLPAGWTGAPTVASASVTVSPEAIAYATTGALTKTAITVAHGTTSTAAIAALDQSVAVTGQTSTTSPAGTATIAWTIAGYNATSAGAYNATGVLTLPTGWTGSASNVSAVVTVSPATITYAITGALTKTAIAVTYGATSVQAVALLDQSVAVTGQTSTSSVPGIATIAWTITGYNATSAGAYNATGVLTLPAGWLGTASAVSAVVTVSPEAIAYATTGALTKTAITVVNGTTSAGAILQLDQSVAVTGQTSTTSEPGIATIAWTIPGYSATSAGAYNATGVLTLPTGWTGTAPTVSAIVNVSPSALTEADVSITRGSIVFNYTFEASGTAITYQDALLEPYYLDEDASTVTLRNSTSSSAVVSLSALNLDNFGTVSYGAITDIQTAFPGLNFIPTQVAISLRGATGIGGGWSYSINVELDPAEILIMTPVPVGYVVVSCTPPAVGEAGSDAAVAPGFHVIHTDTTWTGQTGPMSTYAVGNTPTAIISLAADGDYTFEGMTAGSISVSGGSVSLTGLGVTAGGFGIVFSVTFPQLEAASTPTAIALGAGSTNSAIIDVNVAIPTVGAPDNTGVITWVSGMNDKIQFVVTDAGIAVSSITIGGVAYTEGSDYTITTVGALTIQVLTTETGKASCTRTFNVTINLAAAQTTPTFSPASGAVAWGTTVTVISAGADAIYYTTDGSTPTTGSSLYTAPIEINANTTLSAIAVKSGKSISAVGTAVYTQAAAPTPSSITLDIGALNGVAGVTNVAITVAGGTDSTGAVRGWITGTDDTITFTVTDSGSATSSITINGSPYTSGEDYAIAAAASLTIVVTTTASGMSTCVRTFTVSVTAASSSANLDLSSTIAGNVLTDDLTGKSGLDPNNAIEYSVTISSASAGTAVFIPVTSYATVTAYQNDGTIPTDPDFIAIPPSYDFAGGVNIYLWVKVVSEDGSTTRYYNILVNVV